MLAGDPEADFRRCAEFDPTELVAATFLAHAERHAEIGSTQDRAREIVLGRLAPLPCLVVADRQTAGRGRGDHTWWTGQGALALSLVLPSGMFRAAAPPPLLSVAVAAWLVDVVQPLAPEELLGLRWPNDVYCGERKLAGILIDVLRGGEAIIGIGLNTNNSLADAPAELQARVATLRDLTGRPTEHGELLRGLMERSADGCQALAAGETLDADRLTALCVHQNQWIAVQSGEVRHEGRCLGIAADGGLQLLTAAGLQTVYAGSIQ